MTLTSTPAPPAPPASPRTPSRIKRRPVEITPTDVGAAVGSAASALALTWIIFTQLTAGVGWFGFVLATYVAWVAIFAVVSIDRSGRLVATDRVATVLIVTGAVALMVPLVWLVGYVVVKGLPALRPGFFLHDQRGIGPTQPSTAGGGLHAIVGTLMQVGLALVLSTPLAIAVAVFLDESHSRFKRPVRIMVDAMSGLPSIVAGLFIFAVLILPYGKSFKVFGYNGFMASLSLAMLMLPTITRTVEEVIRLVPDGLREAGLALGATRARTVWSVVLPTARSGIGTAVVLGIARVMGETAPLLLTAFGSDVSNNSPFRDPQESLPLFIYRNIIKPSHAAIDRGFTGALVLMLVILGLFSLARVIGRDRQSRPKRRRIRRVAIPMAAEEASA